MGVGFIKKNVQLSSLEANTYTDFTLSGTTGHISHFLKTTFKGKTRNGI